MNNDNKQWQGKTAVITGAASGIGAGLARYAAQAGMTVYAGDIDEQGLAALADAGVGDIRTLRLDVSDYSQLQALAERVFAERGAVHLLFNNAGVLVDGKSWERSLQDWRWSQDVNVMGVIHGIKAFVPSMLTQAEEGRVINTSSIGGLLGGGTFLAPYQGSKHQITAITESLYQELALEDAPVTASVLCPAEVATGIWECDRHREADDKNYLGSAAEQQFHEQVAGSVAAGMSTDAFAALVFAAIAENKFWILPQPAFKVLFRQRCDSILEENNPLSMQQQMQALLP